METISVIIPVYNGAETLEKTVRAVLAQTCPGLEVLLIDDGSSDGTAGICEVLAAADARVRCFRLDHRGVSFARNFGIARAAGAYLAFVDADDLVPPDYLEILRRTIGGGDAALCDVVRLCGERETGRWTHPEGVLSGREALGLLLERQRISTGPCGKLFRRELLEGLEFPPLDAYEDILFVAETFRRAERIAVTDRTEYRYLQNPAGTMARFGRSPTRDVIRATGLLLALHRREKLGDGAFYATVSHLMQTARAAAGDGDFQRQTRALFRRSLGRILRCRAFGWKEKGYYLLYAFGAWDRNGERAANMGIERQKGHFQ